MITAITSFKLGQALTREQARQLFLATAPTYLDMPGLLRKHYVLSEDGLTAGGIYLWNSRTEADAAYTPEWREFVRGKYGTEPGLAYFESPVVVDSVSKQIISDS